MILMYTWRRGSRLLVAEDAQAGDRRSRPGRQSREEAAEPGARHGGVSDRRSGHRADRAAAQPQALQGAAREERDPHIETADTPRVDPAERVRIEPVGETFSRVVLRFGFMENAERAEGAGRRPQARLAVRHHVDLVLPVAAPAQAGRAIRHAALAGPAVHRPRRGPPMTPPIISRSRPGGWSRSGRR